MDILKKIGALIILTTELVEGEVVLARKNYLDQDFKSNLAIVDSLLNIPIGRTQDFNGEDEKLTYITYRKSQITIDFYGDDAELNANTFEARLKSQITHEYKRDNNIEVFNNKTIQNIKNVQGKTVYDRFQIEIVVKYTDDLTDDVLRIDTAQMKVYTDDKVYDVSSK